MHRISIRYLMLAFIILLLAYSTKAQATVIIVPGDNIVAKINAAPINAVISVQAGTYSVGSAINPKNGQTITGDGLVILTGARTLTNWTPRNGLWVIGGQTQQGKRTANADWQVCQTAYPRCNYPEDVFVDREPLRHMQALELVKPGCKCYYFDYDRDEITISETPVGKLVQTSVTPQGITSGASNVTIRNIVVEMFASPTQDAALQANGNSWYLDKITARFNHGAGVLLRGTSSMRNSDTSTNGQIGWKIVGLNGGQAVDTIIDGNVCNFNNYSGVEASFEAGCSKAVLTTRARITNNTVIGNKAKGLWTDIDNYETFYGGNYVDGNEGNGIYHEISFSAVITGNTLVCNGIGGDSGYYSGINVTNAVDVQVTNNLVRVCQYGNGISVRHDGGRASYKTANVSVIGNTVISETGRGRLANIETYLGGSLSNVTYAGNTYIVQSAGYNHWRNLNGVVNFTPWAALFVGEQRTIGLPTPTPTATPTPEATRTPEIATNTPTQVQPSLTPEMTPLRRFVIRFNGEVIIEVVEP